MIEQVAVQLFNGLVFGVIYCLMATGLTLIFGVMGIINFAHGEFFMLGGYFALFLLTLYGLNPIISIFMAMLIVGLIGLIIERGIITPLRRKPDWDVRAFIVTFALSVTLQNIALVIWGANWRVVPYYFSGVINLFIINVAIDRIVPFIFSLVLIILVWIFIHHTKTGIAIQAVSMNRDAASVMGINVNRIYAITFTLSATLAASAGAFLTPILAVYPTVGMEPLLKSFAVVVMGGLGSVKGSIFSGIILGCAEAITVLFIGSTYKDIIPFLLIILILYLRPKGLFGY
jgi:branched-chain amino acid transport system permease protein